MLLKYIKLFKHLKSVTKIKTQIYRNFFEATSLGVLTRTDFVY